MHRPPTPGTPASRTSPLRTPRPHRPKGATARAATLGALAAGLAVGTFAGASPALADASSDPAPIDAPPIRNGHLDTPAVLPDVAANGAVPEASDGPTDQHPTEPVPVDTPAVRSGRATAPTNPSGPASAPEPTGGSSAGVVTAASPATGIPAAASSAASPSSTASSPDAGQSVPVSTTAGSTSAASPAVEESTQHAAIVGDNLWDLAATRLAARPGQPAATLPEIAAYWVRVCLANQATLRSGDPNVIYPGETIELPSP